MQVEAIYDNGKLKFTQPINLARKRFKIKVDIPDKEVIVTDNARPIRSSLDLLLVEQPDNPWLVRLKEIEERILSLPEDELPELTLKQQQYAEAFLMREES